jgi:hypothetical protein
MLLLLLSRDGESRKSLVCVRLLLCPGRLVRLSMLSVSDKRGATEYVLLKKKVINPTCVQITTFFTSGKFIHMSAASFIDRSHTYIFFGK